MNKFHKLVMFPVGQISRIVIYECLALINQLNLDLQTKNEINLFCNYFF